MLPIRGEQDPYRQHLAGASQPAKVHREPSEPRCFPAEGIFFLLKGQKNIPSTTERNLNLCLHTRKVKSGCSGGWRFPGDRSQYGRPCSGCFAKAAATLGASHAELSTREAKAGSSRGQAAIIIKPTSVNIA